MKAQYNDKMIEGAWQEIETEIKAVGMAEPKPGFMSRFQHRLVEHRAEVERQQAWRVLTAYGVIALVLISVMVYLATIRLSDPTDIWLIWAGMVGRIWGYLKMLWSIILSFGRLLPGFASISNFLPLLSVGGGLVAFWFMMMREYVSSNGVLK